MMRQAPSSVLVLLVIAGGVSSAAAQNTRIINEVSTDGGFTWGSQAAYSPGATYQIRVRVQLTPMQSTVIGLAGVTLQPTLSNWEAAAGDVRIPFTNEADGRGVVDSPSALGRIRPFSAAGMGTGSASGLLTSFNDSGGTLRFAGSRCTTLTTDLRWGVGLAQQPNSLGPLDYNRSQDFVVLFKYAVRLSEVASPRTLIATVPLAGIQNSRGSWYTQDNGVNSLSAPVTEQFIVPALIVVPSQGTGVLGLVGVLMLLVPRRRRKERAG